MENINENVLVIQLIGCNRLKLTNNKNNVSNRNCMAMLYATADKHRSTHIFLHSISTVDADNAGVFDIKLLARTGDFMMGDDILVVGLSFFCGYTGKQLAHRDERLEKKNIRNNFQ